MIQETIKRTFGELMVGDIVILEDNTEFTILSVQTNRSRCKAFGRVDGVTRLVEFDGLVTCVAE